MNKVLVGRLRLGKGQLTLCLPLRAVTREELEIALAQSGNKIFKCAQPTAREQRIGAPTGAARQRSDTQGTS